MPTYRFRNMSTGEEYDKFMTNTEREKYLKINATIAQIPQPIALVGDHIMGVGPKADSGFNERLGQIAAAHPNSPLASRYGSNKSNVQIKAKNIADKPKVIE